MASSPDLNGLRAVVTGATGGIGLATVRRLAAAGAGVVLVARTEAAVRGAAERSGGTAVAADVATEAGVARVMGALRGDVPDIVVHAAGAFELAPLAETSVEAFDRIVAVNLRGAFLLIRAVLPGMLERSSGHIVTIGSIAGRQAFAANGAYSAAKFGVRGLHAVLSAELRGSGVRATFVEPAATDTPLWDGIDRERNPGLPTRTAMLSADEVADAVLYAVTRPRDVAIPNILVERA